MHRRRVLSSKRQLRIFKDIPAVLRGCTKRIQFDGITITGVMSENNEISLNHRDPLGIRSSTLLPPSNPRFHPPLSPASELRASNRGRARGRRNERKGKERKGYNETRGGNVQTVRTIATLANRFRSRAISLLIEAENEECSRAAAPFHSQRRASTLSVPVS